MLGAGIEDGDLLIVDPEQECMENDIIVAYINGENTAKRFTMSNAGRITLKAENPDYEDIKIKRDSDFRIQGVVMWILKNPRKHRLR